ncbi:cytochrome oxidase putative small subunit CydP [Thermomonas alba]|uniref:cytochrome oxidase putative small subunit CydP n=1 Tax=Thermomonas alba TaxID=2888525 RepID=UPI001F048AA6|nr:cytochrome oxidase putative small subunit CydP [Thermomonas alba]
MANPPSHGTTPPSPWAWLRRHLLLLIAIKLSLLALLYVLFFGPGQRPAVDADAVARQLQSSSVPSSSR